MITIRIALVATLAVSEMKITATLSIDTVKHAKESLQSRVEAGIDCLAYLKCADAVTADMRRGIIWIREQRLGPFTTGKEGIVWLVIFIK